MVTARGGVHLRGLVKEEAQVAPGEGNLGKKHVTIHLKLAGLGSGLFADTDPRIRDRIREGLG